MWILLMIGGKVPPLAIHHVHPLRVPNMSILPFIIFLLNAKRIKYDDSSVSVFSMRKHYHRGCNCQVQAAKCRKASIVNCLILLIVMFTIRGINYFMVLL